jgi:hypothetical protein
MTPKLLATKLFGSVISSQEVTLFVLQISNGEGNWAQHVEILIWQ